VHQDCLGLVVGIVACGNGMCANLPGYTAKEAIAGTPRRLLNRQVMLLSQGNNVGPFDRAGEAPIDSQASDKIGIGIRIGTAQAMM
jgi:hypothetical protein